MKNKTTLLPSAVAALLVICGFMPVRQNTPQGVWQQTLLVNDRNGQSVTAYIPAYKLLLEDGSFFNMLGNTREAVSPVPTHITGSGSWEATSDSTYVEHLVSSPTDPSSMGKDVVLNYKLSEDGNLLFVTYKMHNGFEGQEIWTRVRIMETVTTPARDKPI